MTDKVISLEAFREARGAGKVDVWVVDGQADLSKWVETARGHVVVAADSGEMADKALVMTCAQARALGVALIDAANEADSGAPSW